MEAKLKKDKLAIGDPTDHFAYIEACLGDTAAKMALAYVERARETNSEDPDQFITYLDNIYGDVNAKERANNRLNTMSQGKETFATFLPKFERTLAEAGGSEWTDEVKINTLKRMLNQELRKSLVFMPTHPEEYNEFVKTLQTLASRLAALDPRKPAAPITPRPRADEMDWQPSTNQVQALEQLSVNKAQTPTSGHDERKRAQWVSKETLERRKANKLCLRCGGSGHFIGSCKLLPAQPPLQEKPKANLVDVRNGITIMGDDTTVVGEPESEHESGKE
jgi:Retrotransposon gag protein